MKFKTGLLVGLGVGYVLGAKAGRGRYDQIMATVDRIRHDQRFETIATIADAGTYQARETISKGLHDASDKLRDKVGAG